MVRSNPTRASRRSSAAEMSMISMHDQSNEQRATGNGQPPVSNQEWDQARPSIAGSSLLVARGSLPAPGSCSRASCRRLHRPVRIGVRGFIAREWPLLLVAAAATVVIVVAFLHFSALDATLRYGDTIAKLNMARRITDSHTPGLAQMGGVWLPLPVLLMALTTWITPLYTTGLAGALLALPAY